MPCNTDLWQLVLGKPGWAVGSEHCTVQHPTGAQCWGRQAVDVEQCCREPAELPSKAKRGNSERRLSVYGVLAKRIVISVL